jgi:hypothetical protein
VYFPIRVVEYSKPLKPLMSEHLTKKHQPLLAISPLGVGLANHYGPDPRSPKHKRQVMLIPFEQIQDMQVMYAPTGVGGAVAKMNSIVSTGGKPLNIEEIGT